MRRTRAAIADYDTALAINPKLASALYGRGIGEQLQGHRAAANRDINAAKEIDGNIDKEFAHWYRTRTAAESKPLAAAKTPEGDLGVK
jgi:hypothetical protein